MGVRITSHSYSLPLPPVRPAAAPDALPALASAAVYLASRVIALGLLVAGLLVCAAWAGRLALAPGAWLELDQALFRELNGIASPYLTGAALAVLNDPGLGQFALIFALLASCAWRQRAALPAAALAIGVALALGQAATQQALHAGARERPFVQVADARTPITTCDGTEVVAVRGPDGPAARCDDAPADLVGLDWRERWAPLPGFPSGRVVETAALCLLLAAFWPASGLYALAYAGVVAFSAVHLGAHYPSDALGGAALGLWAAGVPLLALDAGRRLLVYLEDVPALRAAWDWVFAARAPGRPDLDPLPARLIRSAAVVAAAQAALGALGFAATAAQAGPLYGVLQSADRLAYGTLTAWFDPARATALYALAGPTGLLYGVLAAATLATAWLRRDAGGQGARLRWALAALLTLAAAGALAWELQWVGSHWFARLPPFTHMRGAPVPPEWRAAWWTATSFPSRHALVVAALAGVLGTASRRLALPAQAIAAVAAATAVYFGVAWLTDALAGYVLGNLAALAAHELVRQVVPWLATPRSDDVHARAVAARLASVSGRA